MNWLLVSKIASPFIFLVFLKAFNSWLTETVDIDMNLS
ncbi:hypothetical protein BQ1740_0131 [Bacillus subtilis]|nr:hypothetical protein BQ1740_0131 [Bacillus subtilis]